MSRKPWRDYFLELAHQVATRATCDRAHVGAVLVRDNRVISTGYNGSPPGEPHCDDAGHFMYDRHCIRTVHAEVNAIVQAARLGIAVDGATLYCTHRPCSTCEKIIRTAGVARVVWDLEYGDEKNARGIE